MFNSIYFLRCGLYLGYNNNGYKNIPCYWTGTTQWITPLGDGTHDGKVEAFYVDITIPR